MKRFFKWLFFGFNALLLVWVIAGIATTSDPGDCGTLTTEACRNASDAGRAIGVGILVVMWAVGAVILGLLFIVAPSKKRDCPACGKGVKKGITTCKSCGHDFRVGVA